MASRLDLQYKLEELLGSPNVYYDPPESRKMSYPAIRYVKQNPNIKKADDKNYLKTNCYKVMVISKLPDDPVIDKILDLPLCSFDTSYTSDGLHHDVMTLYY